LPRCRRDVFPLVEETLFVASQLARRNKRIIRPTRALHVCTLVVTNRKLKRTAGHRQELQLLNEDPFVLSQLARVSVLATYVYRKVGRREFVSQGIELVIDLLRFDGQLAAE